MDRKIQMFTTFHNNTSTFFKSLGLELKVNRDRYNIDAPGCKKKAYMDLDFRTLNGSEI